MQALFDFEASPCVVAEAAGSTGGVAEDSLTLGSSIVPRPYQGNAVKKCFELWGDHVGCMVRQPTGTGKTIVGSLIAQQWLRSGENRRVMVITHERQLNWQFAEELEFVTGIKPAIEMGVERVSVTDHPKLIVASRATLQDRSRVDEVEGVIEESRLYKFDNRLDWLVIWDEAHKHAAGLKTVSHIVKWFEGNPQSRRLGLTATPERTDKKSLARMFPAVASDYRLMTIDGSPCAVNDGWAVKYDQRFVKVHGVDFTALRTVAGDFDQSELENILAQQKILAEMTEPTMDLVGDRRTIIFNVSRDVAKSVSRYINAERGEGTARWLDGTIKESKRQVTYKDHKDGVFQYLCVCGLCREGYNDPGIQAVAVFRPTKSRPLAEQMKGRGCRPLKGVVDGLDTAEERRAAIAASDKPDCMIVDLVGITGLGSCATTAHIYASAEPDDVQERIARILAEDTDGRSVNVVEVIEEAREQIALEKARKEEEAKERARKLRELRASVNYEVFEVDGQLPGQGHQSARGPRMLFGKHKGKLLVHLTDYQLAHQYLTVKNGSKLHPWVHAETQRRKEKNGAMVRAIKWMKQKRRSE